MYTTTRKWQSATRARCLFTLMILFSPLITLALDANNSSTDCSDCDGKITTLTLEYLGNESTALITVKQKQDGEVVFNEHVESGSTFSFTGTDKKGTLGTEILIYVNNQLDSQVHTSCSEPIGPGTRFGAFLVIEGASRNGGALCPYENEDPNEEDPNTEECGDCDGKIDQLTLRYEGTISDASIQVIQKKDKAVVFDGIVQPQAIFSFSGQDKKNTFSTEISIVINGSEHTRIHTSCSEPVAPGMTFGDFYIISGSSRNGGALCGSEESLNGLGGTVFDDLNQDGIQQNSEPRVSEVPVHLYDCNNNLISSTTTDVNGVYSFTQLDSSLNYFLQFEEPIYYLFTVQDEGSNDTVDSDVDTNGFTTCFTITDDSFITNIDAGIYQPGSEEPEDPTDPEDPEDPSTCDVGVSPDQTICIGFGATLTATGGETYLWSNGETTDTITVYPTKTTTYEVTITNGACSATKSVTVTVISTNSCGSLLAEPTVKVYPNSVTAKETVNLQLDLKEDQEVVVMVYDNFGRQIHHYGKKGYAAGTHTQQIKLDAIARLDSGIYYIKIGSVGWSKTLRIFVE
ncbi:SdrD B-like domain-containing protein [Croceiramulus getboli]|nr:SdrD B-like domain-containing protein [Flavobacteriaceae bacterium YJPT1-3]